MRASMWICPGCKLQHMGCSNHVEHLEKSKKCMDATTAKVRSPIGWQGMDLDGPPKTKSGEILLAYHLPDTK